MSSALELIPARRPGSQYTREQILQAAAQYVVTGKQSKVAEATGIPGSTLSAWAHQDWWHDLMVAIRRDKSAELDAMLTGLVHSAIETAQDRVFNGDFRLTKEGELVRVPMSGRDAVMVAAIGYDKRQIGRALPTQIIENQGRLRVLQDQLRQVSGRTIEGEVVDAGGDDE